MMRGFKQRLSRSKSHSLSPSRSKSSSSSSDSKKSSQKSKESKEVEKPLNNKPQTLLNRSSSKSKQRHSSSSSSSSSSSIGSANSNSNSNSGSSSNSLIVNVNDYERANYTAFDNQLSDDESIKNPNSPVNVVLKTSHSSPTISITSFDATPNNLDFPRIGHSLDRLTVDVDVERIRASPRRQNSSRFETPENIDIEKLESFDDVPIENQGDLFIQKINQCKVLFNFNDPISNLKGKEIKKSTLQELIDFITINTFGLNLKFTDEIYREVISMFEINLFRPLPPYQNPIGAIYDPEDDEPIFEINWFHMQPVYEFFLKFLESKNFISHPAKQYIDHKFVLNLLNLFDSEDPRERESLKTILHRIYGKFLNLRAFIRRSINHVLLTFIYETNKFNGISELLEIMGSIINGFVLPLKKEHLIFLEKVLIPLHKVSCLKSYYTQLSYCIIQFAEKDETLIPIIIENLLKLWPKTKSNKEIYFLNEVEELFEIMTPIEFNKIKIPLFKKLSSCFKDDKFFLVTDTTLSFFTNNYFLKFLINDIENLLPIIFNNLYVLSNLNIRDNNINDNINDNNYDNNYDDDDDDEDTLMESLTSNNNINNSNNVIKFKSITVQNLLKGGHWYESIVPKAEIAIEICKANNITLYNKCVLDYKRSINLKEKEDREEEEKMKNENWEKLQNFVNQKIKK